MSSTLGKGAKQGQLPRSLGQQGTQALALALTGRGGRDSLGILQRIQSRVLGAMPRSGAPAAASASPGNS